MSIINNLINGDELIISCKQEAKLLLKKLKKTDPTVKLMHCQIQCAQKRGFKDWFDLYNSIKVKYLKQTNEQNNSLVELNSFETLLRDALSQEVTDIHINVNERSSSIYFRINGEMTQYDIFSYEDGEKYTQTIFENIDDKIHITNKYSTFSSFRFNPTDFQHVGFLYNFNNQNFSINYQSIPTYPNGFSIVMTLSHNNYKYINKDLIELGFSFDQKNIFVNNFEKNGMTILSANMGSGKTVTLNSLMNNINNKYRNSKKIFNLVNGESYEIENIMRVPVIYHIDSGQPNYSLNYLPMKSIKNSNPDILVINDQRDEKNLYQEVNRHFEGQFNIASAIIAHDSIGIIDRLLEFGYSYHNISQKINVLAYQRLYPVLCDYCKIHSNNLVSHKDLFESEDIQSYNKILQSIEFKYNPSPQHIYLRNHTGCSHCNHRGITSRTVCAEVIELDNTMKSLINEGNLIAFKDYWQNLSDNSIMSGNMKGKTYIEHAIYKMLNGQIDPLEIQGFDK